MVLVYQFVESTVVFPGPGVDGKAKVVDTGTTPVGSTSAINLADVSSAILVCNLPTTVFYHKLFPVTFFDI